jgi:hypothetical protein
MREFRQMVVHVTEVAQTINSLHAAHAGQGLEIEDFAAFGNQGEVLIVYSIRAMQ